MAIIDNFGNPIAFGFGRKKAFFGRFGKPMPLVLVKKWPFLVILVSL